MELDEDTRREIATRFAARRKELRLHQEDVATKAGVSVGMVSNAERGVSVPQTSNLLAIAAALDLDIGADQAASTRNRWSQDTKVALDVVGLWLESLPQERRDQEIRDLMQSILDRRS